MVVPEDRAGAVARYMAIAERLPGAGFPAVSRHADHLADLVDDIDVFVLDGFGVLNIGDDAIPGAVERINALQQQGKQMLVLTNGATLPSSMTCQKYAAWGFEFKVADVISSRDALARALQAKPASLQWGFAAPQHAQVDQLASNNCLLQDDPADYARVDGFVLLSSLEWTDERQQLLREALQTRRRPVLVGNPDLVAPREHWLSLEPGLYAHDLADALVAEPEFYGKPFSDVFSIVNERIGDTPPERIAMVGDTLHTDILGGAAAGWRTVLVTRHGLMRGMDVEEAIARSGIRPDYIVATT